MGIFSKTIDYNLILEQVLEGKRITESTKSLLLSMLYKIENSYADYINVKRISISKSQFLSNIIKIVSEYFEIVKTVEPFSKESELLENNKVIAITNEKERTILSYPTESAMLYAIADIEPKYFYIEKFVLKKEFQELLVEGSNLNTLEILENFNGWSWNSKSRIDKGYISNIIYQNLIMMLGLEYIEICKTSSSREYDIIKILKKYNKQYYNSLVEVIYLNNKTKTFDAEIKNKIFSLKKKINASNNLEKLDSKKNFLQRKVEKIDKILKSKELIKKSFELNKDKFENIKEYVKCIKKDKKEYIENINQVEELQDSNNIKSYIEDLELYEHLISLEKSLEMALLNLQKNFLKILLQKSKHIETCDDFIDIIYKIRYYRNIYISKEKAIKDYLEIDKNLDKILKNIITLGTKKAYIRMVSYNVNLNAEVLSKCLDSNSMELDRLKIKINNLGNTLVIEVFDNEIFEKKFEIHHNLENPELTIRKNKCIKIFM